MQVIGANWEYHEGVFAKQELTGKHDGKSIAAILLKIIDEFKLQANVSTYT